MKKLLAIVLMLCLLVPAALAEEAQVQEVNWEDMGQLLSELDAKGITGDFYVLEEIAVKFWLPTGMNAVELTEEDRAAGYIAYFLPDDQSAQVAVVYVDADGMDIETYAQSLSEYGATEIEMIQLNGLPGVSYKVEENDSYNVAFATQRGYILEFVMSPASAENAEYVWGLVGASIQAAE